MRQNQCKVFFSNLSQTWRVQYMAICTFFKQRRLSQDLVVTFLNFMDISIFHANSNNFIGPINRNLNQLHYLYELDFTNKFLGGFPSNVLGATNLTFVDLRFNTYARTIPPQGFNIDTNVLFINNNGFNLRGEKEVRWQRKKRENECLGLKQTSGLIRFGFFILFLLNLNRVGRFYLFLIGYAT